MNNVNNKNKTKKDSDRETDRLFDPFKEHFNWCPWRKDDTFRSYFKIVNQYNHKKATNEPGSNILEKDTDRLNEIIQRTSSKVCQNDNLNSAELIERVRNAQSLLVKCASNFL